MQRIVMLKALFPISLLLSSAACSSQSEYAQDTGIKGDPSAVASGTAAGAPASEPDATPVAISDKDPLKDGGREFSYKWPAAASAFPELAKELRADADRILANEKSEWAENLKDMPEDCEPCRNRDFSKEWKVVANTPGYLSLSGDFSTYTGGAHGMYGRESLIWDKAAKKTMDGVELFASPEALNDALGRKLCTALDAERAKRRGDAMPKDTSDKLGFDACQQVKDSTVLVGSSNGKAFDRIGIWFGPYVAGPYAEGSYELTFPVDASVLKAVKPQYAAAFATAR